MMPIRAIVDSVLSEYAARFIRFHHSPPPEPPTPDQRGGTPPAGPYPSEDKTPPSEPEGSFGDSGGGDFLFPDEPVPYRVSDAELENAELRKRVAELEVKLNAAECGKHLRESLIDRCFDVLGPHSRLPATSWNDLPEVARDVIERWAAAQKCVAELGEVIVSRRQLKAEIAELEQALDDARERIAELEAELESAQSEKLEATRRQWNKHRDELEQAELATKMLADELEAERAKVDRWKRKHAERDELATRLASAIASFSDEITGLCDELEAREGGAA